MCETEAVREECPECETLGFRLVRRDDGKFQVECRGCDRKILTTDGAVVDCELDLHDAPEVRTDGGTDSTDSEQLTVEEIKSRPHPSKMGNEAIWKESDELVKVHRETAGGWLNDFIDERWGKMLDVLERRICPNYPECPHCESSNIGYDSDGIVVCRSCYGVLPEDAREQYRREYARVWGNDPDGGGDA